MKQLKPTMNKQLSQAGLATLDDPRSLLAQIALGIKTHEQFRQLLSKVAPEDRSNCYHSLCSRLPFEPKPLDTYIAEARNQADAEKLPTFDADTGKITEYGAVGPVNLNALAAKAIAQREAEENAKGRLNLVCRRCTYEGYFFAKTKKEAHEVAAEEGWYFEETGLHVRFSKAAGFKLKALCPNCSKDRIQ